MKAISTTLKYVSLLFGIFVSFKIMAEIDERMKNSFDRKEKLKIFHYIIPTLDSCWNPYTKLTFFIACASDDADLQSEIAFFLTNCLLEKNNLPLISCNSLYQIFCHPGTCAQSCALEHSKRHESQLGYNAFDVIQTGIKESVCQSMSVMDDERIWNLRINWEEIMDSLKGGSGGKFSLVNTVSPSEKIQTLKFLLRSLLYDRGVKP